MELIIVLVYMSLLNVFGDAYNCRAEFQLCNVIVLIYLINVKCLAIIAIVTLFYSSTSQLLIGALNSFIIKFEYESYLYEFIMKNQNLWLK